MRDVALPGDPIGPFIVKSHDDLADIIDAVAMASGNCVIAANPDRGDILLTLGGVQWRLEDHQADALSRALLLEGLRHPPGLRFSVACLIISNARLAALLQRGAA